MPANGYRIATLDIENFPNLGWAWEAQEKYPNRQNLIDVDRPWCIASFAYRWEGSDGEPECFALPDFKKAYRNDPFDDSLLLDRMFNVLDSAHLVNGHNIDQFDIRKINARLFAEGSPPPNDPKTFDTFKEAKKRFLLPSYSLAAIAKWLNCPYKKLEHEGWPLWLKCMDGIDEAWRRFKKYNQGDVIVSQWVYHRMRPWSRSHPNITIFGDKDNLCPVCGYKTRKLEEPGPLKSYLVERWRCQRKSCGKTSFGQRSKLDIKVLSA